MKNDPVTFTGLQGLLTDLGFVKQVGNAAVVFEHANSGCRLFYPLYRDTDMVGEGDLVITRHFLDQFGLVERADFEDQLRRHALAG